MERRKFLTGAGLVAAGATLAACSELKLGKGDDELKEQLARLEAIGYLGLRQSADAEREVSYVAGWEIMTPDQYRKLFSLGIDKILEGKVDYMDEHFWDELLDQVLNPDAPVPSSDSSPVGLAKNIIKA